MRNKAIFIILIFSAITLMASKIVADSHYTIWACSNHVPAHVALSIQELVELTESNGCSGWYVVTP